MTVISIQRLRNGVPASADSATLSIINSAGTTVLPTTTITPASEGVYSYTTSTLTPGSYTATWIFTTSGLPVETIARAFTVDQPIELVEGVTLMELEQLTARRLGPYRKLRVGVGSTVNTVYADRLKSSLGLGSYEDMYILRRGLNSGDELITNFDQDDRVRQVSSYDPTMGTLAVDRTYDVPAIQNESAELHALDPDDELRPCVLDGLKRCFFWDTLDITVTGSGSYNINVTSSAPWITSPTQIRDAGVSYPSQILPPTRLQWWEPYRSGKDIRMYNKGAVAGTVRLQVLRPVYTLVNGEMSLGGPNDDLDVVYVDPDYAAWAAVLEAWKNHPELLMPLAAQGMRSTREDAAGEFTKKSIAITNQMPERRQVDFGTLDITQIGNLAEPVS